jgi:hypothetical protein
MTARDLFGQTVSIRLCEDENGFVYTISYGGLPVRRDYVSIFQAEEDAPEREQPIPRRSRAPKRSTRE